MSLCSTRPYKIAINLYVYETVIRPVAIYNSETLAIAVANKEWLQVWEMKIPTKIFGPTLDIE